MWEGEKKPLARRFVCGVCKCSSIIAMLLVNFLDQKETYQRHHMNCEGFSMFKEFIPARLWVSRAGQEVAGTKAGAPKTLESVSSHPHMSSVSLLLILSVAISTVKVCFCEFYASLEVYRRGSRTAAVLLFLDTRLQLPTADTPEHITNTELGQCPAHTAAGCPVPAVLPVPGRLPSLTPVQCSRQCQPSSPTCNQCLMGCQQSCMQVTPLL